jgi:thiol-disulfide isomerase/thioredoxin
MGGKTAIALGLVLGVLAGAGLLAAVLLLAPTTAAPTPTRPPLETIAPADTGPAETSPGVSSPVASPSVAPSAPASPGASQAAPGSATPGTSAGAPVSAGSGGAVTPAPLFGVGGPTPALSLPGLDGDTVDLASLHGQPVWVNFMATWCLPCRDELPAMAGYAARYRENGLNVLLVDEREGAATVKAFLDGLGVTVPAVLDEDGTALADWGGLALPAHFWVDAEGVIRDAALGGIGPELMAGGLGSIMPGVTVTP